MKSPDTLKNKTNALLRRVVERTIRAASPSSVHADRTIKFDQWQWHQGVALYGIVCAAQVLAEPAYLAFATDWVDRRLATGRPGKSINTTAPLLAVARLFALSGKSEYGELCAEFADWCLEEAPRLADGTYEHSCTENRYPQQVWADTLFMGGLFLAEWGRISGDKRCMAEAAAQFVRHYRHLQCPDSGLIVHGFDGTLGRPIGVPWGRGNGWFALASAEVLSLLPDGPERETIQANLLRHLASVIRVQHASGAWHTVLDQPDTYLEMSATAAFVGALGRASLPDLREIGTNSYAAGWLALTEKVNAAGELTEASAGTPVMPTAEDYARVPFAPTCFSQGLAMLAICQAIRDPSL